MTYRGFHLFFNLPLLILLGLLASSTWDWHDTQITLGLCGIVVVFTSPWDNWAVKRNLWNFPSEKILFRIFYCPVEEYLFFLTQTIQACLLTDILRHRFIAENISKPAPHYELASALAIGWLFLFFIFQKIPRPRSITYLWHILFWMLPVIFFQWTLGGIWIQHPYLILMTTLALGTLLSCFDLQSVFPAVKQLRKRPMSASQGCRTWASLFKKRKSI